jgi:hypothetical protein
MATITPTLSITSNASSATTPGPLSFALSLSATKATTVSGPVTSKIEEVTTTHTSHKIFDQATQGHAYIYVNNTSDREVFLCSDNADTPGNRFMSVGPSEFAYFPWSGTRDIYLDHTGTGTKNVEYFIFEKT